MADDEKTVITNSLNCNNCGAVLHYEPGTQSLKCDHCGSVNEITDTTGNPDIESFDYDSFVDSLENAPPDPGMQTVKCNNCGSSTVLPANVTADKCPFCSSPLVIELTDKQGYVRPHYILPFAVSLEVAKQDFIDWLKGLSFAPADLIQKVTNSSTPIDGVYLPYWSFDVDTSTSYQGMRGEYYYITETYMEEVDGEEVMREREVRETNWFPVFGNVANSFRNVIIGSSKSLAPETLKRLGSWDFSQLVNYDERYVSGFRSETYQINPPDALEAAKKSMMPVINQTICEDIGGNEQQISGSNTTLDDVGIKYILLPIWISAYVYKNKTYQFAINGFTGQVSGKRPFSAGKIIALVLIILVVIALIVFLVTKHSG
ncbi:MAG TPA: hypothetical protein VFE53_18620 [Mucilaginibacter sp.]|jgi:LSD1 subclass zinc finger protein|nr:hypothetical protein [Mucilaginibacter sp.]